MSHSGPTCRPACCGERSQVMNRGLGLVSGLGLGAGLMYFFNPQLGRRRRALLRDQVTGLLSRADAAAGTVARDMSHRAQGLLAEARSLAAGERGREGQPGGVPDV